MLDNIKVRKLMPEIINKALSNHDILATKGKKLENLIIDNIIDGITKLSVYKTLNNMINIGCVMM